MKLLIITYHYWPESGPRSFRWRALARHWASAGHCATVITIPLDIGIIDDDEGIKIIRVQENLIGRIRRKMSRTGANNDEAVIGKPKAIMGYSVMRRWIRKMITYAYNFILKQFQWPDYAWTWVRNARKATVAHLDNNVTTDVVISVSHPFSCHFVGSYAKLKYPNIKWIMDCGDPFCFEVASPCNNFALYKKLNHHIEIVCLLLLYHINLL